MFLDISPNFMFGVPVADWYSLESMLRCGVSEVFIEGYLGFCLPDVKKECGLCAFRTVLAHSERFRPLFQLSFQKARVNSTSTDRTSRRPTNIRNEHVHLM